MYRLNLYIPLIASTLIMLFITVISVIYFQEKSIHKHKAVVHEQFQESLNEQVDDTAAEISEYIRFLECRQELIDPFKTGDKAALFKNVKSTYERLNKNVDITHMYFIQKDGSVLLRAHDFDRDGDVIERYTFLKAKETQQLVHGLEYGIKKNFTLRVVSPWIVDGELIGYIELGTEIDRLINKLSSLLKTEIYLAAKKELFANSPDFVKERLSHQSSTSGHYIVYHTFDVPTQMQSILDNKISDEDIYFQDRSFYVSKEPLSDVSEKEIGYFIFLIHTDMEHSFMYNAVKAIFILLGIVTAIHITAGSIVIRSKENSINDLTAKLNEQKESLASSNHRLQKLFDMQKNMVILTDAAGIHMANQALFDFFGYRDLHEFVKYHDCICKRFVDNDAFFHLGKTSPGKNWIDTIKNLPESQQIVAMLDDDLNSHAFQVVVNEFDQDEYIITFTDISGTVTERNELQRKVTHDKLTGAYNREFFDNHIDLIINNTAPLLLGVVVCDIDHFKKINDTYGHNCGDGVLKSLVQVIQNHIRREDYLIRWGGEEFILLMRVDTVMSLQKALENIRLSIESFSFDKIDHISCSFGATLHVKEQESIIETIERADQALYLSKRNGRNQVNIL